MTLRKKPFKHVLFYFALKENLPPSVKRSRIASEYEVKDEIGKGTFSVCKKCVRRCTNVEYAVKVSLLNHIVYLVIPNYNRPEIFILLL